MKKITCLLLLVSATLLFQCTTAKQKKTVRCLDCDGWDWTWTEEAKKEMKKRGIFDFLHRNEFANRWVTNNDDYALTYIEGIEQISLPVEVIEYYKDTTLIQLGLKIHPLEAYCELYFPPWEGDIRKILSTNDTTWIKSCLDKHYSIPPYRYANLIIKNSELEEIKDIINSNELILLQFNKWRVSENSMDTISAVYDFYRYGQYDLTEMYPTQRYWQTFDSLYNKVKRELETERLKENKPEAEQAE